MTAPKDPSEYKKMGAPCFPYDEYLAEEICEAIATSTDSMKKILAQNSRFPSEQTVRKWRYKIPKFAAMYMQAKRIQAELFAEECVTISDESNPEEVNVDRLRVDTRKWVACKLVPRIYGDKLQVQDVDAETKKAAKEIKAYVAELNERLKEYEQPY